jgi:hypothetical protein
MVNSFLCFAATNEFEIYFFGIGPTEIRIYFLALNGVIILLDPTRAYFVICVPIYAGLLTVGLFVLVWKSHIKLWAIDMDDKSRFSNEKK